MRRTIVFVMMGLLSACASREAAPPQTAPTQPEVAAAPAQPPPRVVVHPDLPLEPPGAAAVAQQAAYDRGFASGVKKVDRDGGVYHVVLDVRGAQQQGELQLQVDAATGAVTVQREQLQPTKP